MWDKQAKFTALVNAFSGDLYRYAFWLCHDKHLAEDLVQETFTRAWRAIESLQDQSAARQWLITTLRREHARLYERKQFEYAEIELDSLESVHVDFDTRIEAHILRKCLSKLPREYMEPLLLQVLWGYNCNEIAKLLEITSSAVMTRLFRARQKLRDLVENDEPDFLPSQDGAQTL
jgi:RNA polymerase sigma-70 factor, ECF subfamily